MSRNTALFRTLIKQNKFVNFTSIAVRSCSYDGKNGYSNRDSKQNPKYGKVTAVALFSSVLVGAGIITDSVDNKSVRSNKDKSSTPTKDENVTIEAGDKMPGLPIYRADEVSKHDSKDSFWVTYRHGVYDVTSFLTSHPGGEQILNAGGLSIEPFWNVYGMHKTPEVYQLLETFRIGNLHDDDIVDHSDDEMWVREPVRDKRLIIKTQKPFNAEVPPTHQIQHFDTPNELFYVRQHMAVPELDACQHRLRVTVARGGKSGEHSHAHFRLTDLRKYRPVEVRAALMCAGNRRSEMNKQVKPVKGISWAVGAISSARWSGVLLRDVLLDCGVDETDVDGKHVIFQGSDIDATGVNFSTSIPLSMALNPNSRIVLATHMNGEVLPPDHGYPLRVIVPGAPAVRSVKWLESIIVSSDESPSHWHQKDYRSFNPSKTWETADFSTAPPMYSLPVTSAICYPIDGDTVPVVDGCVDVKGYAYSGGGAKILRVDVSIDRGESWCEAELVASDDAPPQQHYAWTLWAIRLPAHSAQQMEIWVKATDSNFNSQPENFNHIWNIRGLLSNAYHKITVRLQHKC